MPGKTKAKDTKKKAHKAASAFVASNDHGDAIIGINDLRVVLTDRGSHWLAQGVEIDYATVGNDIEDVKRRFENGLRLTLRENLKVHGDIGRVLVGAPSAILFGDMLMLHSQASFHDAACLNTQIAYLVKAS